MSRFLTSEIIATIDPRGFALQMSCQFCGWTAGREEELFTGAGDDDESGWSRWFCCHACRDKGTECETMVALKRKESHQ